MEWNRRSGARLGRRWLAVALGLGALLGLGGCAEPGAVGGVAAEGGAGHGGSAVHVSLPGGAGGGGAGGASTGCDAFATEVVSVAFGPGQSFGQDAMPGIVLGPPHGGGVASGSLDVVSLGDGGELTLAFGGTAIVDGPGADFVVFENPFQPLGDPELVFAELGTVAVSADGVTFVAFPCSAEDTAPPPYGSCAGWHPVLLDGDLGPVDPATSGGDAFDLADVGLAEARFVRVVDRPDLASVLDLDAVGIVHPSCSP